MIDVYMVNDAYMHGIDIVPVPWMDGIYGLVSIQDSLNT